MFIMTYFLSIEHKVIVLLKSFICVKLFVTISDVLFVMGKTKATINLKLADESLVETVSGLRHKRRSVETSSAVRRVLLCG